MNLFNMGLIKRILKSILPEFLIPKKRYSHITSWEGDSHTLSRAYQHLINRTDIEITSVSVTRIENNGIHGYVNRFMITISYNYYK